MTTLADLSAAAIEFAARKEMILVPAAPDHDCGPQVRLDPKSLDLPGFLALAARLGGGVLYHEAPTVDPEGKGMELPESLAAHRGEIGCVTVAFAANGVIHFWEQMAPWYDGWLDVVDDANSPWRSTTDKPADEEPVSVVGRQEEDDERPSEEEQARLTAELVEQLLADPAFRAAKQGGARSRYAKLAVPEGTYRWVAWDAQREAIERADELTQQKYAELMPRLDKLAAELLSTEAYRQASSVPGRKLAVEQFLTTHADGFSTPAWAREELYARAQQAGKAARQQPTLL